MIWKLSAAALAALLSLAAHAADHRVSTSQEMAQAVASAVAGDTITLAPGNYGSVVIHGGQWNKVHIGGTFIKDGTPALAGPVTIRGEAGHPAPVLASIDVRDSDHWRFDGVSVEPGCQPETFTAVHLAGDGLAFLRSTLTYGDPTGWDGPTWLQCAGHGVAVYGTNGLIEGNDISTVATGIQFIGDAEGGIARGNTIWRIGGDGLRTRSDDVLFEFNRLTQWRVTNPDRHYDCLQAWDEDQRFNGVVRNIVFRFNTCYAPPEPGVPLFKAPMGVTVTHTTAVGWLIEHNIIATNRTNGINFFDARGVTVRNNTVLDIDPDTITLAGERRTLIRVNGDPTSVIEGNITNWINPRSPMQLAGNLEREPGVYDDLFADWQAGDFTLIDPAGPGATIHSHSQPLPSGPLPAPAEPVIQATKEYWQVVVLDGVASTERVIAGAAAPLAEAEARAIADQINGGR